MSARRQELPLSSIQLDMEPAGDAAAKALRRYAMRVVYTTLDNVEAEAEAGTRADAASSAPDGTPPPRPFIPGTS